MTPQTPPKATSQASPPKATSYAAGTPADTAGKPATFTHKEAIAWSAESRAPIGKMTGFDAPSAPR